MDILELIFGLVLFHGFRMYRGGPLRHYTLSLIATLASFPILIDAVPKVLERIPSFF